MATASSRLMERSGVRSGRKAWLVTISGSAPPEFEGRIQGGFAHPAGFALGGTMERRRSFHPRLGAEAPRGVVRGAYVRQDSRSLALEGLGVPPGFGGESVGIPEPGGEPDRHHAVSDGRFGLKILRYDWIPPGGRQSKMLTVPDSPCALWEQCLGHGSSQVAGLAAGCLENGDPLFRRCRLNLSALTPHGQRPR